jgi:hypothetical protein
MVKMQTRRHGVLPRNFRLSKRVLAGLLFILVAFLKAEGISQQDTSAIKNMQLDRLMQKQIICLKNGALLVRLQARHHTIELLRKQNDPASADKIEKQQHDENTEIISAFRKNFTFCPVYFFYADHSSAVKEKKFDKVVFLNDSLHADSSIKLIEKCFLIAEFGNVEPDTGKYFENYYYTPGEEGPEKKSAYGSGPDMGFSALVIRSDAFVQLRKPFPYYVKTNSGFRKKEKASVVSKMNNLLADYYKQNKGR